MELANKYIIEKSNVLNEVRRNNLSLQELRFLSIYLSKINSRDLSSRVVTFPLDDFRKIMELGRLNNNHIKSCFEHLLQHIITVPNSDGTKGFTSFQLFKRCKLYQDDLSQWYIEIDAHDESLPLMFGLKHYVKYELWNALRLKSTNQLRMYELLKQYEKIGERTFSILELKSILGLEITEYPRWIDFRKRVLDSCQKALAENTDLIYTYEPIKVGRKFTGVKFTITKNEKHVDQITLSEFIELQPKDTLLVEHTYSNEYIELLASACDNEFDEDETMVLSSLMNDINLDTSTENFVGEGKFLYLQKKYNELNARVSRSDLTPIKNRFLYLKSLIN